MNNVEMNDRLEKEIYQSEKAAKAYALWVMNYISDSREHLFNAFYDAELEEYPYIHAEVNALNNIECAIKADIQTGDLARKQLKGE
jgi:hypothetical protein